ncbi:MAG: hypothetical protein JXR65_04525 [Bacteroidales bacterium]|nr:hypothetical protein [Bacteroidales bacterium]
MKRFIVFILLFAGTSFVALAQTFTPINTKLKMEIGYAFYSNFFNGENYFRYKAENAPDNNITSMSGLNLKFSLPTKIKCIDLFFGALLLKGNDRISSTSWSSGNTNSSEYILNGGGVYFGISPRTNWKIAGFNSEFALGIFSFKEYTGVFDNLYEPYADIYEKKATGGLGAMSSVGVYLNVWKIGINPKISVIYSGSSSASFTFLGVILPVTFRF